MLFDRLDANTQAIGRFLLGKALHAPQDQCLPRGFGQAGQEVCDLSDFLPKFELLLGPGFRARYIELLHVSRRIYGNDPAMSDMVDDDRSRRLESVLLGIPYGF